MVYQVAINLNILKRALAQKTKSQPKIAQPTSQSNPNFKFQATGKPSTNHNANWQFLGGTKPVPTPNVQTTPQSTFSLYSDPKTGGQWYEDDKTGHRIDVAPTPGKPALSTLPKAAVYRGAKPKPPRISV